MSNTPKRKTNRQTKAGTPRSRTVTPQKAPTNWPRIFAIAGGAVLVGVILATVLFAGGDEDLPEGPPEGIVLFSISDRAHTAGDFDPVDYGVPVPAGGNHNPIWQNCGFYDEPIRTENAVHSLEHGAVWVTYRRDLGEDAIDSLRGLVRNRTQVLVSEVPAMDAPLMATAWGVQLELETYDDVALRRFIKEFEDGQFAPEVSAGCSGGLGNPA